MIILFLFLIKLTNAKQAQNIFGFIPSVINVLVQCEAFIATEIKNNKEYYLRKTRKFNAKNEKYQNYKKIKNIKVMLTYLTKVFF